MTIPVWVLLAFAGWTLLTLTTTVGLYRWGHILTGRASISEWSPEVPQGSDWYRRAPGRLISRRSPRPPAPHAYG